MTWATKRSNTAHDKVSYVTQSKNTGVARKVPYILGVCSGDELGKGVCRDVRVTGKETEKGSNMMDKTEKENG